MGKNERTEVERARKSGYRLGLRTADTIVRKAKSQQDHEARWSKPEDADLRAEYEHAGAVLDAIRLRLHAEIKKVMERK